MSTWIELALLATLLITCSLSISMPAMPGGTRRLQELPVVRPIQTLARWLDYLWSSAPRRIAIRALLLVGVLAWLLIRFEDGSQVVAAMLLEIGGITVLAVEVWTGHEAERYDLLMDSLEAEFESIRTSVSGGINQPTKATGDVLSAIVPITWLAARAAGGRIRTRSDAITDLDQFRDALTEWRQQERARVFGARRQRVFLGVLLLAAGAVAHTAHLLELPH